MSKYSSYNNLYISAIAASLTLLILSTIAVVWNIKELTYGIIIGAVLSIFVFRKKEMFNKKGGFMVRLFLTKIGYAVGGVAVGLVILATVFNVFYEGGWFNFTDFFFWIIANPLALLIRFNFNNDNILSRPFLYLIVFINLAIITYLFDLLAYFCIKLYKVFKKSL